MSIVRHTILAGGIRAAVLREIVNGEARYYLSYINERGQQVLVRYKEQEHGSV